MAKAEPTAITLSGIQLKIFSAMAALIIALSGYAFVTLDTHVNKISDRLDTMSSDVTEIKVQGAATNQHLQDLVDLERVQKGAH